MVTIKRCMECGNSFKSYNKNPKFCSKKCKDDSARHKVNICRVEVLYNAGFTQTEIASILSVTQKVIHKRMLESGIKSRVPAKRYQKGENNDSWKGDNVSYSAFHARVVSLYGKPKNCSVCGASDNNKHYDWACLNGRYQDISDYKRMCRSCHWKHDKMIRNINHMRDKEAAINAT